MSLVLGLSIAFSGAFGIVQVAPPPAPVVHLHASSQTAQFADAVMASPADPEVHAAVEKYFADIPIMITIASCESRFHQYDLNGGVLMSVTDDIGVMQINTDAHSNEAAALGYDLSTVDGNMAFARYLYDQEGTAPWYSSQACWQSRPRVAQISNATSSLALNNRSDN